MPFAIFDIPSLHGVESQTELNLFLRSHRVLKIERQFVAQAKSVPVYVVFTNEQLAQVVQQGASSLADLEKIDGIGGARAEKYGQRLLDSLAKLRVGAV